MQTESQLQSECVIWLWNTHSETRKLFFSVNNNSEHIARAMARKSIGLVSGVSDCLFIWCGTVFCFEFKTLIGKQSPAQIEWQKKVEDQGVKYFVVKEFEQFKQIINGIL